MVEGQIHRLKLIKRQMYGRAGFDLLRLRVLQRARLLKAWKDGSRTTDIYFTKSGPEPK